MWDLIFFLVFGGCERSYSSLVGLGLRSEVDVRFVRKGEGGKEGVCWDHSTCASRKSSIKLPNLNLN